MKQVEQLSEAELEGVRPLLTELVFGEQASYPDHPQLSRSEVGGMLDIPGRFQGENVVLVVRVDGGSVAGFCWCVLFDPGTGLEGEVAEVYVAEEHRGQGVGEALLAAAVELFRQREVTLGYVWTRADNRAAVRLYGSAGFEPTRQLVMTWYPTADR